MEFERALNHPNRALSILVLLALTPSAWAGWDNVMDQIKAKTATFGGNSADPKPAAPAPQARFAPAIDECNQQVLANEQASFVSAADAIGGDMPPPVDAACFDKYRHMRLGAHIGVPDFSGVLQQLMNQLCRAADTKFNAATAPYNKTVWGQGGTTVNTGVFQGGQGGISAGTNGQYQVPNLF